MNKKQVSSSGQQRIQRESGSVVVIVAVSLTALLGFAGLAIDYGYAFSQKTRLQSLADAAALACGYTDCVPSTAEENKNDAVFAPINQDATPLAVQIVLPSTTAAPTDCPRTSTKCFQVTATQQSRTFFLQIFSISTLTTNAVATAISGEVIPPDEAGAVPAILALSRDQAGVSFTGGTVTISGDVNSNSDIVRTGSTSVTVNPLPKTENSGTLNAVGVITGFNSLPAARRKQGIASLFADPCAGALRRQDMAREANFASCLPPPKFSEQLQYLQPVHHSRWHLLQSC